MLNQFANSSIFARSSIAFAISLILSGACLVTILLSSSLDFPRSVCGKGPGDGFDGPAIDIGSFGVCYLNWTGALFYWIAGTLWFQFFPFALVMIQVAHMIALDIVERAPTQKQ